MAMRERFPVGSVCRVADRVPVFGGRRGQVAGYNGPEILVVMEGRHGVQAWFRSAELAPLPVSAAAP